MKRLLCALALPLALTIAACSDDDDVYPSVKLEYMTVTTGSTGALTTVVTDDGVAHNVAQDGSGLTLTADSTARIVGYYEELTDGLRLYSASTAVAPLPKAADEFDDGIVTKAAAVRSIWLGYQYLNIVLTARQQGTHTIGFVEQSVADTGSTRTLNILLYHDSATDDEDYTKTAYLSIPLQPYLYDTLTALTVCFSLYTTTDGLKTYTLSYEP